MSSFAPIRRSLVTSDGSNSAFFLRPRAFLNVGPGLYRTARVCDGNGGSRLSADATKCARDPPTVRSRWPFFRIALPLEATDWRNASAEIQAVLGGPLSTLARRCGCVVEEADGLVPALASTAPHPPTTPTVPEAGGLTLLVLVLSKSTPGTRPSSNVDTARAGIGLRSTTVQPGGSLWSSSPPSRGASWLPSWAADGRTGRLRRSLPAWINPNGVKETGYRIRVRRHFVWACIYVK